MEDNYVKNVGGRGKKNPWKTVVMRVPEPLIDNVRELEALLIASQETPLFPQKIMTKDQAIEAARKVLSGKQGARKSMSRLLSLIYGESIEL